MGAEAEFVDLVAEVEGFVAEVLLAAEFHVAVAAGRDVEVALDFVAFEGAVDAAGVGCFPAVEFGGFLELFRWVGSHVAEDVGDVLVFFFGSLTRCVDGA